MDLDLDSEIKLFFPYIDKYNDIYNLSYFLTKKSNYTCDNYYKFTINNYNLFIIKTSILKDAINIIDRHIPVKLHTTVLYFHVNVFVNDNNKEIYLERILPNYSQFIVHTLGDNDEWLALASAHQQSLASAQPEAQPQTATRFTLESNKYIEIKIDNFDMNQYNNYSKYVTIIINSLNDFINKIEYNNDIANFLVNINTNRNIDNIIDNLYNIINSYNNTYDGKLIFDLETKCINAIVNIRIKQNNISQNERIIILDKGIEPVILKLADLNMESIINDVFKSNYGVGYYLDYDIFISRYNLFKTVKDSIKLSKDYNSKYDEITKDIDILIKNMENFKTILLTQVNNCTPKITDIITPKKFLNNGLLLLQGENNVNYITQGNLGTLMINEYEKYKSNQQLYNKIYYINNSSLTIAHPVSIFNELLNSCKNTDGGSIHSLVKNMLGGSISDEKIIRKLNNETIRNKIKSYYKLNSKKIKNNDEEYYNKLHELYISL